VVGIQKVTPNQTKQTVLPDIAPMRRGRPKAVNGHELAPAPRTPSTDPWAALDSNEHQVRAAAADELASKFPSLDEFAILHDQGTKFQFEDSGRSTPVALEPKKEALHKRVTEALADEAFAKPIPSHASPAGGRSESPALKAQSPFDRNLQTTPRSQPAPLFEPAPQRPSMVSTGTMTSAPPSPPIGKTPDLKQRLLWRGAASKSPKDITRFHSQELGQDITEPELPPRPEPSGSRPNILERARTKSQSTLSMPKPPASSRPSLEGQRPPTLEYLEPIDRSKSANARPRPTSLQVGSSIDYLKGRESGRLKASPSVPLKPDTPKEIPAADSESSDDEGPDDHITSDVDFLRSIESTEEPGKKKSRRSSSGSKPKRSSIPSISLSGTKNILAGRFGDAFRRFETNSGPGSDPQNPDRDALRAPLSPIMGSEATGTSGRSDEDAIDETQDIPPEVRRELERRRLSQEERRVATAAAEYRERLDRGDKPVAALSKASFIQNRVKNLLANDHKGGTVTRTAEGYGRYTESPKPADKPATWRKPVPIPSVGSMVVNSSADVERQRPLPGYTSSSTTASAPTAVETAQQRTGPRPSPAPKPLALRTGVNTVEAVSSRTTQDDDDWETNFTKRYPSLSGIEMVETEITKAPGLRGGRDV
jgi:AP2-associated kinase